jgi:hypothetical protein
LIDERHRCYVLNRFPYSIIVRAMTDKIVVVALAHGRRDSAFWQGRQGNGEADT